MTHPQPNKRRVKARKAHGVYINGRLESLQMNPMPGDEWPLSPVFVLPADPESVERMVEQVARAIHGGTWTFDVGEDHSRECYYDSARAVLANLGLAHNQQRKVK